MKLFGTDGVRGAANLELTPELAFSLGKAGAFVLTKECSHSPKILVADDTRRSADMLVAAISAGMCSVGAQVILAGSIPTPAVAFLVKKYKLDAGVMISASHNKFSDNGIKFFSREGFKLSDELEISIEEVIASEFEGVPRAHNEKIGTIENAESALDDYVDFIKSTLGSFKLDGMKIALDCSNGATFEAAPIIFHELGAQVFVCCNEPNGININANCGSTHIDNLVDFVRETGAEIGFAFDGDGDRLIAVDEGGNIIDGDMIMSILAQSMKASGSLAKDSVVATVMSNLGFMNFMESVDINVEKTKVGDRYVLEHMLKYGYNFGGEQSGHLILLDYATTGDGILSAVHLAKAVSSAKKPLSELNRMKTYPQVLINAKVALHKKEEFSTNLEVLDTIKAIEKKYDKAGRVLIRPSGTEPVIRVMIEGENQQEISIDAKSLAELIERVSK